MSFFSNHVIRPFVGHCDEPVQRVFLKELSDKKKIECVPLIMTGKWHVEYFRKIASFGMLATPDVREPAEMAKLMTETDKIVFNFETKEDILFFYEVTKNLENTSSLKSVYFNNAHKFHDFIQAFSETYENTIIFAGPFVDVNHAPDFIDVPVLGLDTYYWDDIEAMTGIKMDAVQALTDATRTCAANFPLRTIGDIAKSFALGADFVFIPPTMPSRITMEAILDGIEGACAFTKVPRVDNLWRCGIERLT